MTNGVKMTSSELDFEELLKKYDYKFQKGDLVKGIVCGYDSQGVMVDIGAKTIAVVPTREAVDKDENVEQKFKKGDEYEFLIIREEDEDGKFLLSRKKVDFARSKGIENIIIDPGIGFGKSREDNFEIIRRVEEFESLGCPIMLGISRKSLLDMQNADNFDKDIYTTAINALAVERNVDYIRVHNVKMHKKLIDLMSMFMVRLSR